ncbi:threonylcarbamoyl-AMP synthase [bacterium]|nr:threonylcarbamoyl-AMP synthase [bacterium]
MIDEKITRIDCSKRLPATVLDRIKQTLDRGQLIICPTESSYLLGGNIFDKQVHDRIFDLKKRNERKALPAIVADETTARDLVRFNALADVLVAHFWPGPLTVVLPIREPRLTGWLGQEATLGLRVPAFPILNQILEYVSLPLVSTSANISNAAEPYAPEQLLIASPGLFPEIGLVLLAGTLPYRSPSTVVNLSDGTIRILREGAISRQQIESALSD